MALRITAVQGAPSLHHLLLSRRVVRSIALPRRISLTTLEYTCPHLIWCTCSLMLDIFTYFNVFFNVFFDQNFSVDLLNLYCSNFVVLIVDMKGITITNLMYPNMCNWLSVDRTLLIYSNFPNG